MNIGSHLWSIKKQDGVRMSVNNNIDMTPTSTRYLVADYLTYRLGKNGHTWPNSPPLEVTNKIHITMRTLADGFEEQYTAEFSDMLQQLHITPNVAYPTFNAVTQELFIDGINWGRVVALFVFGGAIAIECCEKNMSHLIDSVYDWMSTYVETHLEQWISSQGGWNALAEFYEKFSDKKDKSSWPPFRRIFLGAVGVLALGALFTQKS